MSSKEWKTVKLSEIAYLNYGKSLTSDIRKEGKIPVYSSSGITGWHDTALVNEDGIVIGRKGNVGSIFYADGPFYCIDTAYYIKKSELKCNIKYFYYLLKILGLDKLNEDSAVPGLNRDTAHSQLFSYPEEIDTQRRIADILAALDDKIELNRQTNATLEAIAQAIFKEWFVDFNFPGATGEMVESELGMIPKGWRVGKIGELFHFVIGGDWGKEKPSKEFSVQCAVIRGTDLEDIWSGQALKVPRRYIKLSNFRKRELIEGDIILEISGGSKEQATGRNLLIIREILDLFAEPAIHTSFCRLIRAKNFATSIFLGTFLRIFYSEGGTWDFQLQSTGISNFQFVDFENRQQIIIPSEKILDDFMNIVLPLYRMVGTLNKQSNALAIIRGSLLPKLMSGEIDV